MLNYFIKNRHGVVSVFCAVILIVIMSFTTLLMEIGRKRSMDAAFQQAVENAGFSTLANYDDTLYKRFGLLAINPDVDSATFENYLEANLNRNLSQSSINATKMEAPLAVQNIEIEKMYDLTDTDVMRNQIEEAFKYRAPIETVNDTFGLEGKLKDFIKNIEKSFPMISFMMSIADMGKAIAELISVAQELGDAADTYKTANDNYSNGVVTYNKAVEDYNNTIATLDPHAEDYADNKAAAETTMESATSSMNSKISSLLMALSKYEQKATALQDKVEELYIDGLGFAVQVKINDEKKKIDSQTGQYALWTLDEVDKYKGYLDQIYNANTATKTNDLLSSAKALCKEIRCFPFSDFSNRLTNQKSLVNSRTSISEEKFETSLWETIVSGVSLVIYVIDLVQQIVAVVEKFKEAFNKIKDISTCVDIVSTVTTGANIQYNDNITGVTSTLPSYQKDANFMDKRKSYMNTVDGDRSKVESQLQDTTEIANDLSYDLDAISPRQDYSQSDFEEASHRLIQAQKNFVNTEKNFWKSNLPVIRVVVFIINLVMWVVALVELLVSFVNYLKEFIKWFSFENVIASVYSNLIVANYAVNMFPNRTTDTLSLKDKDILRNQYSDASNYWSSTNVGSSLVEHNDNFSVCRAEYIYAGTTHEIENQQKVYDSIYKWRALNNLVLLVMDDFFRSINQTLLEIPVLGWIAALLIDFLVIYLESTTDMILLCCGGLKFCVIKTDMWLFSLDGMKEFSEKLQEMFESNTVKESIGNFFDSKTQAVDNHLIETSQESVTNDNSSYVKDGIFGWDYKDYLQFLITFENNDYVVTRIADLIQLEMNARYQKAGKGSYDLSKAYTYIRVSAEGEYKPLLPVPTIPGANAKTFLAKEIYYCGY